MSRNVRRFEATRALRRLVGSDVIQEASAHGRTVDELCFWKHQAIWHRAWASVCGHHDPDDVDMALAERQLEQARIAENRERGYHAEPPWEIGS